MSTYLGEVGELGCLAAGIDFVGRVVGCLLSPGLPSGLQYLQLGLQVPGGGGGSGVHLCWGGGGGGQKWSVGDFGGGGVYNALFALGHAPSVLDPLRNHSWYIFEHCVVLHLHLINHA